MLVVLRFAVGSAAGVSEREFLDQAQEAIEALAARPGYLRGQLGRAYDDPAVWCLATEWESVGSYRRALGAYDVKLRATALLARCLPEASAFEVLATAEPAGQVVLTSSDAAVADGGSVGDPRPGEGRIRSHP